MNRHDWIYWSIVGLMVGMVYVGVAYFGPPFYHCEPAIVYLLSRAGCEGNGNRWFWGAFFLLDCIFIAVVGAFLVLIFSPIVWLYRCIFPPSEKYQSMNF